MLLIINNLKIQY